MIGKVVHVDHSRREGKIAVRGNGNREAIFPLEQCRPLPPKVGDQVKFNNRETPNKPFTRANNVQIVNQPKGRQATRHERRGGDMKGAPHRGITHQSKS
jgi:hypothetical protein